MDCISCDIEVDKWFIKFAMLWAPSKISVCAIDVINGLSLMAWPDGVL